MISDLLTQHKYAVIGGLTFVLILIIVLISSLSNNNTDNQNFRGAKGEPVEYQLEYPTPDESQIGDTGYMEDEYTPQEVRQIDQITDLREKSPFDGLDFVVDYNYETFQFDVILYEPYDESETAFNNWRRTSYSDIPREKFNFIRQ